MGQFVVRVLIFLTAAVVADSIEVKAEHMGRTCRVVEEIASDMD